MDLTSFEKGACVEFGASEERSKSQFRIILGGWNGEKSRIAAYNSVTKKDLDGQEREHSKSQWENIR